MDDLGAFIGVIVAFAAAALIAFSRPPKSPPPGTALTGLATLGLQTAHFLEELGTGFYIRFPELLGFDPWTYEFFVVFNAAWILIWLASLWALEIAPTAAGWMLWFLALAGVLNGLAHPALALATGGYFPGLVTSPVLGVCGFLFARKLWLAGLRT